jgi:two-component system, NtrC family, sensor kinase
MGSAGSQPIGTPAGGAPARDPSVASRAEAHYRRELSLVHVRRDRVFAWLMLGQWGFAIMLALLFSSFGWEGKARALEVPVSVAVLAGGLFTLPIWVLMRTHPGAVVTRHAVAVAQMLYSALFLHLSGGRIETHVHVFASFAFLAFYRDARLLVTATLVVAVEHLVRNAFGSGYGWRMLEPAFWVVFENAVLMTAIAESHAQMREVAERQAELESTNASIEETVARRTLELERSREQFRALVESTNAVPWELDPLDMQFRYVGPQVEETLGITAADFLLPGFLEKSLHPEDRRAALARFERIGKQGDGTIEARLRRPNGRFLWLKFLASSAGAPMDDDARDRVTPVVRGLLFDMTEARELETELHQAQKLESVGRLAAGVAHEINTPVQFVSDSVYFVRDAMKDLVEVAEKYRVACEAALEGILVSEAAAMARRAEEKADLPYLLENVPKALDRALEGLERVTTIVRSMKEFAHPDQKEMALADLNQAVSTTLVIAKNEYKYVAELDLQLGEIPHVKCHVGDLNQVVLNILVNGAHAIADVVKDSGEKGRLGVRTRQEGNDVVIEISDTGGGIPLHVQSHVFDPFFTTKEVGRGTGQGLAIARSVVCDKHGGELTFETLVGQGTTFFIRLPIEGRESKAEAA